MNNNEFSQILDMHGISNIDDYLGTWLKKFIESNYNEASIIVGMGTGIIRKKVISVLENTENFIYYLNQKNPGVIVLKKFNDDMKNKKTENVFMTSSYMDNYLHQIKNTNDLKSIKVNKVFGLYDYKINFYSENIFVLHAPNGCGKTHLLKIINSVFKEKKALLKLPFESVEIHMNDEKYNYCLNQNKNLEGNCPNLECIFMNDILDYSFDEIKNKFLRKTTLISYRQHNIDLKVNLFNEIMNEFFCFEKEIRLSPNWQKETEIDNILDITYKEENKANVCNVYQYGQNIPFDELSTGEKNTVKIIFRLIFEPKYGSFIMIDEPEISLHMEWQLLLIKNISKIAKESELKVLIATHSPYIVESANIEVGSVEYAQET